MRHLYTNPSGGPEHWERRLPQRASSLQAIPTNPIKTNLALYTATAQVSRADNDKRKKDHSWCTVTDVKAMSATSTQMVLRYKRLTAIPADGSLSAMQTCHCPRLGGSRHQDELSAARTAWCDPVLSSFSANWRGVLPEEFFARGSAPHRSRARTISTLFSWTATCKG